jgi:deoxyribonuclease-4
MEIKFGPAGFGGAKEAVENLEHFRKLDLRACEVAFTYGVYLKKDDAVRIGKVVKKLGIELSIHAPYWINLNSKEKAKIEASKKRILKSCEIGHYLNAKKVVIHSGFYSGMKPEEAFVNIKSAILEIMEIIKKNKWDIELCPEIMGKKNVFGSIDEISNLVKETGCGFCIDFAHVLARYGRYEFTLLKKAFPQKKWHCHFSGIEYGEKGEQRHKKTPIEEFKRILGSIPKSKEVVIINESPDCVKDSVVGLGLFSG